MTGNGIPDSPSYDPRFPDRPNTPDFWRLVEIATQHDGEALEGKGPGAVIQSMIDEPSLMYLIQHRLGTAFGAAMSLLNQQQQIMVMAIYMDAFSLGYHFKERGGHRD
jgi:hypothetical protein